MAAVFLAGFAVASPFRAAPAPQEIPYEELARSLLADAGMQDATPASFRMEELLRRAFLRADLGLFELYVPRSSLAEDARAHEYGTLALALLDAQSTWLDWIEPAGGDLGTLRADLASLRTWVAGWKSAKLAGAGASEDALELLAASAATREASERFSEAMGTGSTLGLAREGVLCEPIVLCPRREDFVRMASLGGWLYPQHRGTFWQPAIANWTYCYVDRFKFLALELAAPGRGFGDWSSGVGMNARSPTGLAQQTVQLCANSMFDNYFASRVPPSFAGALAVNLVIDLYGECSTRIDGDLRERRTSAREFFVPGGNPNGGILPPNLADSPWRNGAGADRFVEVLRTAQSEGAKQEGTKKEKHAWFLLHDEHGTPGAVRAPFLGAAADGSSTNDGRFYWDRLEFLRSYRTCFVWWLQNEAESTPKKSRQQFAKFLRALAVTPEDAVEATFRSGFAGAELSSPELSKKDLEGRFLAWLAKQ